MVMPGTPMIKMKTSNITFITIFNLPHPNFSGKYESAVESIAEDSATVISDVSGDTDPNTYNFFRIQKEKFIELWHDSLTDWAGA